MKFPEVFVFSMVAGFIGYCFNSLSGFAFGFVWAIAVVIILSIFEGEN